MKDVVLDTETTGLSVKDGHRIVEIGCIELDDFVITNNVFHCYLNPERKVSESAFKVHGYTDEFLSKQKKFTNIAKKFLEFIDGKNIIIHNADFDLSHLNNELSIAGLPKIKKENITDTLEIARDKFPGSSVSLDALCKRFRIDNSKREKHNAIIDCKLLAKVYVNLLDQKEPLFNFLEPHKVIKNVDSKKKINHSKKIITASEEEINLHKLFLKNNLKKNYF